MVRHDNGLVSGSKRNAATVAGYVLTQAYIAPYTPEQKSFFDRFIRSRKQEFVWHRLVGVL